MACFFCANLSDSGLGKKATSKYLVGFTHSTASLCSSQAKHRKWWRRWAAGSWKNQAHVGQSFGIQDYVKRREVRLAQVRSETCSGEHIAPKTPLIRQSFLPSTKAKRSAETVASPPARPSSKIILWTGSVANYNFHLWSNSFYTRQFSEQTPNTFVIQQVLHQISLIYQKILNQKLYIQNLFHQWNLIQTTLHHQHFTSRNIYSSPPNTFHTTQITKSKAFLHHTLSKPAFQKI